MRVEFELLGQPFNPVNRHDITLEVNHDQESVVNDPKPHVGVKNLYLVREDIEKIMTYLANPPGITEGAPFKIKVNERGITATIDMYFNLMEGFKRSDDGIEATVTMVDSLDHINNKVDGFTLESMYNETGVVPFRVDGILYQSYQDFFDKRCIFIPYVLSSIPNRQDAFQAIFSITYVIIELQKAIKFVVQWATPIPDSTGVALAVGQLIAEIAFIALLLSALIVLIIHLFKCLIQAIKYHGAMLMIDMLKIVSVKLGCTFQSSIWTTFPYNQIAYLPEKYNPLVEVTSGSESAMGVAFAKMAKTGFQSPGYAIVGSAHDSGTPTVQKGYMNGTGGDVLRFAKRFCNGKIILPNGTTTLLMERRDFYPSSSSYQLPDIRQDWNGFNTEELFSNILIRFQEDLNDKNCIDKYIGTIFQATHGQIMTNNQRLVLLKGMREIIIGAARGIRKTDLNMIELIHLVLEAEFNTIKNAGIDTINFTIKSIFNPAIQIINVFIKLWNTVIDVIEAIIGVIATIINAIGSLFGGNSGLGTHPDLHLQIKTINPIAHIPNVPLVPATYGLRIDTLLLENDMVTTPKLIMVDTLDNVLSGRNAFTGSGGYSGQKRIAYLHPKNDAVVNAGWLWNNFYAIDCFVDNPPNAFTGTALPIKGNRFTKISPSLNKDGDKNPCTLSLADFLNIVSNPKIKDNFAEDIITDSVQWRIGDESGRAEFTFRKQGWLSKPQSNIGSIRAQEININLQVKTSLPNGQ